MRATLPPQKEEGARGPEARGTLFLAPPGGGGDYCSTMLNSVRRLFARPFAVPLVSMGFSSP